MRGIEYLRKYQIVKELGERRWKLPNGISISEINNGTGSTAYGLSFLVIIPKRLTGTKRIRQQFPNLDLAARYAQETTNAKETGGTAAFALTPAQTQEAVTAFSLLKKSGLSLVEAVNDALQRKHLTEKSLSIEDASKKMLEEKIQTNRKERTIRSLRGNLKRIAETFPNRKISTITTEELRVWLRDLSKTHRIRTQKNYRNEANNLFNWCALNGFCNNNPLLPIPIPKEDWTPPVILSLDEVRRLLWLGLHGEKKHDRMCLATCVLGLFAGIRTAEINRLDWEAVNLDKRQIRIGHKIAKKRQMRVIDITPQLAGWLKVSKQQKSKVTYLCESGVSDCVAKFRRRAGFAEWSKKQRNAMRSTFASMHFVKFGDIQKTVLAMGHSPKNEQVLFDHYRNIVSKEDAEEFFNLSPKQFSKEDYNYAEKKGTEGHRLVLT
jgi:integrase